MKKIFINISDSTYEKFRLEAIQQQKDIPTIISERIMNKPFSREVEESFQEWINKEVNKILEG